MRSDSPRFYVKWREKTDGPIDGGDVVHAAGEGGVGADGALRYGEQRIRGGRILNEPQASGRIG